MRSKYLDADEMYRTIEKFTFTVNGKDYRPQHVTVNGKSKAMFPAYILGMAGEDTLLEFLNYCDDVCVTGVKYSDLFKLPVGDRAEGINYGIHFLDFLYVHRREFYDTYKILFVDKLIEYDYENKESRIMLLEEKKDGKRKKMEKE